MKTIILIFTMLLSLTNCTSDDGTKKQDNSIIGIWKLIETYDDPGDGSGNWVVVSDENSYTYQFNDDVTFIRNGSVNDCTGTFSLENNFDEYKILTLKCQSSEVGSFTQYFHNKYLIIDGTPYSCDESCVEKFAQID